MALTRKLLKSLGLEEAVIDSIIEAHGETVDALKKQRDDAAAEAEKASEVTRERDQLRKQVETLTQQGGDAQQVRAEFDAYRQTVESEKANALKKSAVRKLLKNSGVQREEFADLLMGKVDLDAVEMDGEDIKNPQTVVDPLQAAYGGCFAALSDEGTKTQNPPTGGGIRMTREQIAKIEDRDERRAAIAANLDLFN